ncbi:MAG: ferredoxin-thioredoxin reductase catalytic domain-containing protein [Candidatus Thorarchaeota archaeon]
MKMNMETIEGMQEYVKKIAEINNWILNKDKGILDGLVKGLVHNKKSYGYQSCPCRLASGSRKLDRDIICPCDYAPADVIEYGTCYCNLFMRKNYYETVKEEYLKIPERRPREKEQAVLEYLEK